MAARTDLGLTRKPLRAKCAALSRAKFAPLNEKSQELRSTPGGTGGGWTDQIDLFKSRIAEDQRKLREELKLPIGKNKDVDTMKNIVNNRKRKGLLLW